MTTQQDRAREAARHTDGRFGTQERDESTGVDLLASGQVPMTADDNWGALTEAVTRLRRDAYEQGQVDAYAKAADLVAGGLDGGYTAVSGYEVQFVDGGSMRLHDHITDDIAAKALHAQAESLRAYATGGFAEEADAYLSRTADAPIVDTDTPSPCPACDGTGYGTDHGDGLRSGPCDACASTGRADMRRCEDCEGSGSQTGYDGVDQACTTCTGAGHVAKTPLGRDVVEVPGRGTFYRLDAGEYPTSDIYAMRFEANRPLTDDEVRHLRDLFAYRYTSCGGEPMGDPERDSDQSFVVDTDTTKGRAYRHLSDRFEPDLDDLVLSGSPIRKTARTGPVGSRAVEGLGDPDLHIELYYGG